MLINFIFNTLKSKNRLYHYLYSKSIFSLTKNPIKLGCLEIGGRGISFRLTRKPNGVLV